MFLNSIDPSSIDNQGTNITAAIDMAAKSFSEDKKIGKAIILITDAEDLEDSQSVMDAAKTAARNGIQARRRWSRIYHPRAYTCQKWRIPYRPRDLSEPVRTALNEDLATEIASAGKGIYVNASNNDALNELTSRLDTVKKSALESSFSAIHDGLFAIFVWFALALIVVDIFVLDRKDRLA